jgi:hypothetical protein
MAGLDHLQTLDRVRARLLNAAPRLHRNKLATAALANKLARIAWSILLNKKDLRHNRVEAMATSSEFAKEKCMERINDRIQSLVALWSCGITGPSGLWAV